MRIIVWPRALAVVIAVALLLVGCRRTDTPTPTSSSPLPSDAQWSEVGEIQLSPSGSVPIDTYVQAQLKLTLPRTLCKEYDIRIEGPGGQVETYPRTPRVCSPAGGTSINADFKVRSAGGYMLVLDLYEFDQAGTARPDSPITRRAAVTGVGG